MYVRDRNVLEREGKIMTFEKRTNYNGIVPLNDNQRCSGCSNYGQEVYNGKHTAQNTSKPGRCSNC